MRLLVDANLSPSDAVQLCDAGHDAAHVIDVGLATVTDPEIVEYAETNDLVIVTVDTDFPMLIALRRATSPSIVLLRGVNELAPDEHAALVIANLPASTMNFRWRHRVARTRPPQSPKPAARVMTLSTA